MAFTIRIGLFTNSNDRPRSLGPSAALAYRQLLGGSVAGYEVSRSKARGFSEVGRPFAGMTRQTCIQLLT